MYLTKIPWFPYTALAMVRFGVLAWMFNGSLTFDTTEQAFVWGLVALGLTAMDEILLGFTEGPPAGN